MVPAQREAMGLRARLLQPKQSDQVEHLLTISASSVLPLTNLVSSGYGPSPSMILLLLLKLLLLLILPLLLLLLLLRLLMLDDGACGVDEDTFSMVSSSAPFSSALFHALHLSTFASIQTFTNIMSCSFTLFFTSFDKD